MPAAVRFAGAGRAAAGGGVMAEIPTPYDADLERYKENFYVPLVMDTQAMQEGYRRAVTDLSAKYQRLVEAAEVYVGNFKDLDDHALGCDGEPCECGWSEFLSAFNALKDVE